MKSLPGNNGRLGRRQPAGFIFLTPCISSEVLFTRGQIGIGSQVFLLPESMFFLLNHDVSGKRNAGLCV